MICRAQARDSRFRIFYKPSSHDRQKRLLPYSKQKNSKRRASLPRFSKTLRLVLSAWFSTAASGSNGSASLKTKSTPKSVLFVLAGAEGLELPAYRKMLTNGILQRSIIGFVMQIIITRGIVQFTVFSPVKGNFKGNTLISSTCIYMQFFISGVCEVLVRSRFIRHRIALRRSGK